jgi:hypothetical protein
VRIGTKVVARHRHVPDLGTGIIVDIKPTGRQEADELRAYTGHDDRLIGYPVEIKHTAA